MRAKEEVKCDQRGHKGNPIGPHGLVGNLCPSGRRERRYKWRRDTEKGALVVVQVRDDLG